MATERVRADGASQLAAIVARIASERDSYVKAQYERQWCVAVCALRWVPGNLGTGPINSSVPMPGLRSQRLRSRLPPASRTTRCKTFGTQPLQPKSESSNDPGQSASPCRNSLVRLPFVTTQTKRTTPQPLPPWPRASPSRTVQTSTRHPVRLAAAVRQTLSSSTRATTKEEAVQSTCTYNSCALNYRTTAGERRASTSGFALRIVARAP